LISFLLEAASHISYGLENEKRSTPLTISASLIPTAFSQHSVLEIMASLVPSICREINKKGMTNNWVNDIQSECASIVPIAVTTESLRTLLSEIHSNQTLWNCNDVSDKDLSALLQDSLLV
jgi:hypothetical protein